MRNKIKFSIITVCYNSAKTIRQTFEAMLTQTCQDYEYIVVDGGSTDSTLDIIKEYSIKFNGKMYWTSEADKGIYDAINKGVAKAKGDIVGIINSDDYYTEDALEIVAEMADKYQEADIYYGVVKRIDKNGNEIFLERRHHTNLYVGMIGHPASFVKNGIYKKDGLYDASFKLAADYDFMLKALYNKRQFCPVDKVLAVFSDAGATTEYKFLSHKEVLFIRHKYGILSRFRYYCELLFRTKRIFLHKLKLID